MNTSNIKHALATAFLTVMCTTAFAQVGVGTANVEATAVLEVSSTTQGFLPPRMTETQRDAINSPATGLVIFNTDDDCLNIYDGTGWAKECGDPISGSTVASGKVTDLTNQVAIGTTSPDESAILEMSSTEQGFLPPRLTETERDAISNPSLGLVVFNIDSNCLNISTSNGWYENCGAPPPPSPWGVGYVHCGGIQTEIVEVISLVTNKTWMDRNLGARRVATKIDDTEAYGDLYQWGRFADGHQCRDSNTTTTLANSNTPEHGDFIINANNPFATGGVPQTKWREPTSKDDLWDGVNGINNPCPLGFRLPTLAEVFNEFRTLTAQQVFDSPMRIPLAGTRFANSGVIGIEGSYANYWTSSIATDPNTNLPLSNANIFNLSYASGTVGPTLGTSQAAGLSVRCIKD